MGRHGRMPFGLTRVARTHLHVCFDMLFSLWPGETLHRTRGSRAEYGIDACLAGCSIGQRSTRAMLQHPDSASIPGGVDVQTVVSISGRQFRHPPVTSAWRCSVRSHREYRARLQACWREGSMRERRHTWSLPPGVAGRYGPGDEFSSFKRASGVSCSGASWVRGPVMVHAM